MNKVTYLLVTFSLLAIGFVGSVQANNEGSQSIQKDFKQEVAHRLAKKYEVTKTKIIKGDEFTRKVKKTLYSTNKKLMHIQRKKNKINSEIQGTSIKIDELNTKISALEKGIGKKKKKISKQVRALYKLSKKNKLMYILKSKSFNEFERNKKFLNIMTEADYDKIISYANDIKELGDSKKDLKKTISQVDVLAAKLQRQDADLRKQVASKRVLLKHLKKQKSKYLKQLSSIKNTTEKLALSDKIENLNDLFGTDFFEQKGYLQMPIVGKVYKKFGIFKNPVYKNKIKNNGYFISSLVNQTVKNVHPGKVSFVGEMRGLGSVVIIDHGDHYYSIYGNNKTVLVQEGDKLNIHHPIAKTQYSPIFKKNGSYFEIRYFSEPINPKNWFTSNKITKR